MKEIGRNLIGVVDLKSVVGGEYTPMNRNKSLKEGGGEREMWMLPLVPDKTVGVTEMDYYVYIYIL